VLAEAEGKLAVAEERYLEGDVSRAAYLRVRDRHEGRAASKSSCRHLSCVDAAKDELRRGVNMVVLSGASTGQVTLTWPEGRC
jgi:hypothetical protein